MGTDKAVLAAPSGDLLERAIACVEAVAGSALLACGPTPRYAERGRELVLDAFADGGPLAGLLAGLERTRAQRLLVLAVDMPEVESAQLAELLRLAQADDLDVALLSSERGDEPLCSVVHRRSAPLVRAALERGERRMIAFHAPTLRIGRLAAEPCLNLNTPADLAAWRGAEVRAR